MATITYDADGPGKARLVPVLAQAGRVLKIVTGRFSFDTSYPTGGEDITDIFDQFKSLQGLLIEDPTSTAGALGKSCIVDYTNKKLMLFDNGVTGAAAGVAVVPAQVANLSDQSGIANLRFMAWGV